MFSEWSCACPAISSRPCLNPSTHPPIMQEAWHSLPGCPLESRWLPCPFVVLRNVPFQPQVCWVTGTSSARRTYQGLQGLALYWWGDYNPTMPASKQRHILSHRLLFQGIDYAEPRLPSFAHISFFWASRVWALVVIWHWLSGNDWT